MGLKLLLPLGIGEATSIARAANSTSGAAGQAEPRTLVVLDRPIALRRGRLPAPRIAADGVTPSLEKMFSDAIDSRRLQEAFSTLRVPRHLFKFIYRVFTAHCNAHTENSRSGRSAKRRFSRRWRCTSASRTLSIAVSARCEETEGEKGKSRQQRSQANLPLLIRGIRGNVWQAEDLVS